MTLIRRQRPVAALVEVEQAPATPTRFRRARMVTSATKHAAARTALDISLKSIAEIEREIDDASERLALAHAEAEQHMRAANISEHSDGVYRATIEEKFTRQDTTIDPKKFKNAVADKDFWACCTIGVTKAQEVLGKKEIATIADVKPAKSLGHVFSVKPVKKK